MADVKYVITVDSTGAQKAVETFDQAMAKLAKTEQGTSAASQALGKSTTETSGIFSAMEKQAGQMWAQFATGQFIVDGVRKAFGMLKDTIGESIKGALQEEQSEHRLGVALESVRKFRRGTLADMMAFAKQQSQITLYTHEEVEASMALLATLTHLDADGIKAIMPGIEGLAAVLGPEEGLTGATRAVQRAMEGQSMGLRRAGIIIDDTLPRGEKLIEIQRRLAELVPVATEALDTTGGAITQAGKAYDEFKEKIGHVIVEGMGFKTLAQEISKALKEQETVADNATAAYSRLGAAQGLAGTRPGGFGFMAKDYGEAAEAAKKLEAEFQAMQDVFGGLADAMKPPVVALTNLTDLFKDLSMKGTKELTGQLRIATEALDTMLKEGGQAPGVIEAVKKKILELNEALWPGAKAWRDNAAAMTEYREAAQKNFVALDIDLGPLRGAANAYTTLGEMIGGELGAAIDGTKDKAEDLAAGLVSGTTQVSARMKTGERAAMSFGDTLSRIAGAAQNAFSQMDSAIAQGQRNREIAIDNEYKRRLAVINSTIKDEDKKQKAIMALEAEFQIKKTAAQAAGAKQQKAIALAAAIMNTAEAISAALTMKPWTPFNFALAAMAGALGAIQVALIAKQPIPLAKGAVFNKPTLLPARYEVAEAGEPEIVSPKSTIRDAVREAMGQLMPQMAFAGAGANVSLYLTGPLIEAHGWSDNELRVGADKLVGYVNEGLRRIGHRQI